ncbi:MAG: hypothetical protein HRT53_15095 [Colwellia sp.]|nr:hypothetical protein [Colwellia sp.]
MQRILQALKNQNKNKNVLKVLAANVVSLVKIDSEVNWEVSMIVTTTNYLVVLTILVIGTVASLVGYFNVSYFACSPLLTSLVLLWSAVWGTSFKLGRDRFEKIRFKRKVFSVEYEDITCIKNLGLGFYVLIKNRKLPVFFITFLPNEKIDIKKYLEKKMSENKDDSTVISKSKNQLIFPMFVLIAGILGLITNVSNYLERPSYEDLISVIGKINKLTFDEFDIKFTLMDIEKNFIYPTKFGAREIIELKLKKDIVPVVEVLIDEKNAQAQYQVYEMYLDKSNIRSYSEVISELERIDGIFILISLLLILIGGMWARKK